MFKNKIVHIALVGDAKETYINLDKIVKEELIQGKIGTEHQKILKSINRTIELLKENPQYGIHIKKKNIPKYYIEKFGAENLWKCDIYGFWRIIYWIDGSDEIKIVSFILDIINHEIYNKIFNYRNH